MLRRIFIGANIKAAYGAYHKVGLIPAFMNVRAATAAKAELLPTSRASLFCVLMITVDPTAINIHS
jgi:hypothetical protein